jgi:hypothetical protein
MLKPATVLFVSVLLFLCSCGKQHDCKDRPLGLGLVGFDSTELNELKVVAMDGNVVLDSAVFKNSYLHYFVISDTAMFHFDNLKVASENILSKKYEWKITVLKTGTSILISDIQHEKKTKKCGGIFSLDCFTCYNPITSVNVNGISQKPGPMGTVYLYK